MITYSYGSALVTLDEVLSRTATGHVNTFLKASKKSKDAKLKFSNGVLLARNLVTLPDFVDVKLYGPLRVEVRQVYTGNNPHSFLGLGNKGMLITSAVKGITSYNATPRAVNFLRSDAQKHTAYREVAATDIGTPLVFYTKALTSVSTNITLEMVFQAFPTELFQSMTKIFSAAGSIPIFAPASAYLLAASAVSTIAGSLGKALLDGTPAFKQTEPISFITPGTGLPTARFLLLSNDSADPALQRDYMINDAGELVASSNGSPYSGDEPYIIIFLDGRAVSEYESFQPNAASAALLDRFYKMGENNVQPADALIQAMNLFSDMKYRKDADALAQQISSTAPDDPGLADLKARLAALIKNISNADLKPKTGA